MLPSPQKTIILCPIVAASEATPTQVFCRVKFCKDNDKLFLPPAATQPWRPERARYTDNGL